MLPLIAISVKMMFSFLLLGGSLKLADCCHGDDFVRRLEVSLAGYALALMRLHGIIVSGCGPLGPITGSPAGMMARGGFLVGRDGTFLTMTLTLRRTLAPLSRPKHMPGDERAAESAPISAFQLDIALAAARCLYATFEIDGAFTRHIGLPSR